MRSFDEIAAAADAVVASRLGGPVTISPRVGGEYGAPAGPDPERDEATVLGIYSSTGKSRVPAQNFNIRVEGVQDTLWISFSEAQKIPYDIRIGDLVTVSVRGTPRKMKVTAATRCDQGSYEVLLSEEVA